MTDLRLEQSYRQDTGAPNGSLLFEIHHLSGAPVTPLRLCYSSTTRPAADMRVDGGRFVRSFANHVEIEPPAGLMLSPGDVWNVAIHGLTHPPVNRTQGAMAAWLETGDTPVPMDLGDLQPPAGHATGAPKDWPAGALTLPICLLPWPAEIDIAAFDEAPLLHPGSTDLTGEIARVAALHRRLFPSAPATFSIAKDVAGRPVIAKTGDMPAGGFALDFSDHILLTHGDADGLRHGLIALAQISHAARTDARFAFPREGRISDAPRHGWRGLMLDVSRNFLPAAKVSRLIDIMAWHRMNRLQWHLTDDEGWRLPIRGLPHLTTTGATRARGTDQPPQYADGPGGQSGAYSETDIHALVAQARDYGIEIMPEIDMPGHMTALLATLPELRDPDEPEDSYRSIQGYPNNALNPGMDAIWPVIETIFDAVTDLFPFGIIHVGGDEVDAASWANSPAAQALVAREGLAPGAAALQSHFMRRVQTLLRDRGRRMAGWDECADGGGVEADALLFAWRNREKTAELIARGYDVICTPGQHYYLDMIETAGWNAAGTSWAGMSAPEASYAYEATDAMPDGPGTLAGVQAGMWCEHINSTERFNDIAFPRLSAVAEAGWTTASAKDWQRFAALSRLMPQL